MRDGDLRSIFSQHLRRGWHWVTVETGGTGRGVPDAEYCAPGGLTGWVEFKVTNGWAVGLRPEQGAWLAARARAGGRATVAVRRRVEAGPRRSAADQLWLVEGWAGTTLRAGGLRALEGLQRPGGGPPGAPLLGVWEGGPARWDWAAVADVLTRPAEGQGP